MIIKAAIIPMLYLDYEIRKEYIVKNICVNRSKPQLHCDGKCYLAKRLAENQKKEEKAAETNFLANLVYQVMGGNDENWHLGAPSIILADRQKQRFYYHTPLLGRIVCDNVFHPPLV